MINDDELCDVPICINYHTDVEDFHILSTLVDYDPLFCYECLETIEPFDNDNDNDNDVKPNYKNKNKEQKSL